MTETFDFWKLIAGLGIFLFGMRQLEQGLKQLAGKGFRQFLRRSTDKPLSSIFSGIVATTIVQSSSLVGLIVLALVGAGIIPLTNAIGIILGSNLGTTFTGWIVATIGFKLNLQAAALPILGLGALGTMLPKGRWQSFSLFLLGLAFILMGLEWMKSSVSILSEYINMEAVKDYPVFIFLLGGVIFTAIIQSSSATMMITLTALNAGIIPLPAAAALVIGADLGTTSTVLLGSFQGTVAKRRVAMAHVLFNLTVDVLAFLALFPLLVFIEKINISDPLYTLVVFHSLFNVLGIILFLPFLKPFANSLIRLIPEATTDVRRYIQNVPADVTDVALEALTNESHHIIDMAAALNLRLLHTELSVIEFTEIDYKYLEPQLKAGMLDHYEAVKVLESNIMNYSLEIQAKELDKQTAYQINNLLNSVRHAIYSSKSLKDIRENIHQLEEFENPFVAKLFKDMQELTEETYHQIFNLLKGEHDLTFIEDELAAQKEKVTGFYASTEKLIYANAQKSELSKPNLSTLLNVNKELYTSFKALIKSIRLLLIRQ